MLSSVNQAHAVFSKDYMPPSRLNEHGIVPQAMFADHNNVLASLPDLSAKELRKRGSFSFMTQKQRLELQLQKL